MDVNKVSIAVISGFLNKNVTCKMCWIVISQYCFLWRVHFLTITFAQQCRAIKYKLIWMWFLSSFPQVRDISAFDFIESLKRIRRSVPPETMTKLVKWNEDYGDITTWQIGRNWQNDFEFKHRLSIDIGQKNYNVMH